MTRKSKTKPFLTKADHATVKKAYKILAKCSNQLTALTAKRLWCDMNKDKDPGGAKWQKASCSLYQLLDEVDALKVRQLMIMAKAVVDQTYR